MVRVTSDGQRRPQSLPGRRVGSLARFFRILGSGGTNPDGYNLVERERAGPRELRLRRRPVEGFAWARPQPCGHWSVLPHLPTLGAGLPGSRPRRLGFPGSYSSSSSGSAPGARPRPFDPRTRAPRDVTAALIQRALRPTRVSRQRARVGVGPPPSTGAEPRELQTRPATDAYPAGPRAPGKRQPRGLGSRGSGDRTWPGPAAQGPGKLTERGTSPQPGRWHPLRTCLWVPAGVPVTCVPALGHGGEAAVPLLSSLPSPGPLPAPKCEGGQDWGGWPLPSSAQTVFKGYLVGREGDSFARESPLGIPRPGVPPPHLAHLQLGNGVALVPRPWPR